MLTASVVELIGRAVTGRRRYRCHGCGRRFWDRPTTVEDHQSVSRTAQRDVQIGRHRAWHGSPGSVSPLELGAWILAGLLVLGSAIWLHDYLRSIGPR
jgi:hypothetical protein